MEKLKNDKRTDKLVMFDWDGIGHKEGKKIKMQNE